MAAGRGSGGEGTWTSGPGVAGHEDTVDATPEAAGGIPPADAKSAGQRPATAAELLPVIGPERYEVSREFARGGLGRILAAHDKRLSRPVAIKELIRPTPENEVRFAREVRITARLQHPAIVPVYEAGRWPGGAPFYAMRMVKGVPLSAILKEARTLAERIVLLPHLIAVADAMAYAHARQVVHRDLKPSNILCGSFGETVVIDWGLAKDLAAAAEGDAPSLDPARPRSGDETIAGAIMGTPAYMPPEQAAGIAVDERADVYSLGAILYHMIAGEAPYGDSVSVEELLDRVKREPPRALDAIEPGVPPDLAAVVHKAMSRDREDRYATAEGLAEDLHSYADGRLVGAHRYSTLLLVRRWMGRHRGGVAITLLIAAVLAMTASYSAKALLHDRDAARATSAEAENRTREERQARVVAEQRVQKLVLAQARTALAADPTAAISWLRQVPPDGAPDGAMRIVAQDAIDQGVASEILPRLPADVRAASFAPGAARLSYCTRAEQSGVLDLATRTHERYAGASCGPADQLDVSFTTIGAATPQTRVRAFASGAEVMLDDGMRVRALRGHKGRILALAFTADGSSLLSASEDGTIRRWPMASHAPRWIPPISTGGVQGAWFVQGNDKLLVLGAEGEVDVIDLASNAIHSLIPAKSALAALSVMPGQTRFAIVPAEGAHLQILDAAGGTSRQLAVPDGRQITAVQLLPGGKLAAVVAGGKVGIVDLSQGWQHELGDFIGGQMRSSADGRIVAVFGGDVPVRVWNVFTREEHVIEGKPGQPIDDVALSPDGTLMAAALGSEIIVVQVKGGTRRVFSGHRGAVWQLEFSLGGGLLASGGEDGTLRVWEPTSWIPRTLGTHDHAVSEVVIAPAGDRIATVAEGKAWLWDVASGERRRLYAEGRVEHVSFSPDGTIIAARAAGGIQIWTDDLPSGSAALLDKLAEVTSAPPP